MEKKKKFNPYFISLMIIIVIGLIIFFDITYRNSKEKETWVVCDFKPVYTNYKEVIKFRYIGGNIYGFYREETITKPDDKDVSIDDIYKERSEAKPSFENNDDVSYTVDKKDDKVIVKTYINISKYPEDFDKYAYNLYVNSSLSSSDMKRVLESTNYYCKISNK